MQAYNSSLPVQSELSSLSLFGTRQWSEVNSGLLEGPINLKDIPLDCPLSRWFGIQQGAKVRCIDDFSRSSVNSCVQTCESKASHDRCFCSNVRTLDVSCFE